MRQHHPMQRPAIRLTSGPVSAAARHRPLRSAVAATGGVLLAISLAACGDDEAAGSGDDEAVAASDDVGGVAADVDLSGVELTVGSKEFTEQEILGAILVQTLEAAGADVTDQTGLTGTPIVRAALESGEVDLYYEYTGTGWINVLGNETPVEGQDEQFEAVREADEENGITWFARAPGNNTYAIAANQSAVEEYGVESISDYAQVVEEDPAAANLCTATEFVTRDDGLPGLAETYDFDLPDGEVTTLDFNLVYTSVGAGEPCDFAVVFATDANIAREDLVVLEDDEAFFPAYNLAVTMSTDVYEENAAAYEELLGAVSEFLDDETLTSLNAEVDVEGRQPAEVAEEFLQDNGII